MFVNNRNKYTKTNKNKNQDQSIQEFIGYDQYNYDELPIMKYKKDILYAVDNYSTVIIIAETGSGKTTKIPQFLYEAGYSLEGQQICVSVPRRIAAISVGNRVAQEMGVEIGQEVGYSVRFDQKFSDNTSIKFLTDGMLINEVLSDPLLNDYSVLMIDDIHERTINTDLILGLIKKIRKKRPNLKIIVSSATIDAQIISKFFEDQKQNLQVKTLFVEGRRFDIDLFYLNSPCRNYVLKAVNIAIQIHKEKVDGDILIFLTSQEEIQAFIQIMEKISQEDNSLNSIILLPLYSSLPLTQQMEVFKPADHGYRKIIVSTNIAESSITINGIVYVIDSLFHKIKYFDYKKGIEELISVPISKSSADQRKGRAGRVRKGECYRLITEEEYQKLFQNSTPEILRCQLMDFIISLKQLGVGNVLKFDLVNKPSEEALAKALEFLYSLDIIDKASNLTDKGKIICEFPLECKISAMILNSFDEKFASSEEILILASMLSVQGTIFFTNEEPPTIINRKKRLGAKEGDHITLINIFLKYKELKKEQRRQFCFENKLSDRSLQQADKIHEQLTKSIKKSFKLKIESAAADVEAIQRTILSAFFMNIAQKSPDGTYRNIRNKEVLQLHPQSILTINPPSWVVYNDVVRTNAVYMRECTEINQKWILELAPHFYQDNRQSIAQKKHETEIKTQIKFEETKDLQKKEKDIAKETSLSLFKKKPKQDKKPKLDFIKDKSDQNKKKAIKQQKNMLSFGDEEEF